MDTNVEHVGSFGNADCRAQARCLKPGPRFRFDAENSFRKLRKSAAAIRKEEKAAKREKALVEKQLLVQRLGLDGNVEVSTVRASAEAVNSMRARIAEMNAKHNKFVQENDLRLELFPE